jgi:hypothetical protein
MSNPLVCNVEGPIKFPDQKLNPFQPIPKATDLPSALKAIQAITNNFETVRVFNPDNPDQWVDVQQITGLSFTDPVTGRTLVWRQ